MPRELVAVAPRTPVLRDYEEPPLGPCQIRIRSELASPKHGTELVAYRDEPAAQQVYDREWGVVLPRPGGTGAEFPRPLGNMAVGMVTERGAEARRFQVGDRVFGHFPIRETQTVDELHADPMLPGLSAEAAVCLDPAVMAMAMRDGGIKLGDRVAIFGLGAIGLLAVQLARLAGARSVIAIDPLANRRYLALAFGADVALDPRDGDGDVGLTVRRLTTTDDQPHSDDVSAARRVIGGYWERPSQISGLGVDVAVEAAGSIPALHQAIRATRYGGTICVLSYYGGEAAGLRLGEEFHINRLQLVSARAESLPSRDAPGWTLDRLVRLSLDWLASGRLRVDGIVSPIVPFADAVAAYRDIDMHPERSIKLGICFP